MKTAREICLGIAVAGVVAGAGSALGCAVALADPAGPDSATASTDGRAAAPSRSRAGTTTANRPDTGTPTPQRGGAARRIGSGPVNPGSAAASRLVPAPAAPLIPLAPLPIPAPVVPVAPAAAVTLSTPGGTPRSRSASATASASQIGDPPVHVLLIGTDGTNLSKILADPTFALGGFYEVMSQGVTGTTTLVGHTTVSGPSWSTILTGAWDDKTGVINNIFNPRPYNSWPTVFNLLEYNKPSIDTSVIADWDYINDVAMAGGYPVDNSFYFSQVPGDTNWSQTDALVTQKTVALIQASSPTDSAFMFSYQVQVDEVGHLYGGGSPQYAQAVQNVSANISDIMDAVEEWENTTGESWVVIVTTDHGHQQSKGFGHGFQSPNETSSFIIFRDGNPVTPGGQQNLGYSNTDITPTIVDLFGIAQRSDFDGTPLQNKFDGLVDPADLQGALRDAIAMYGYPNIGLDITLGVRSIFTAVPYFIDGAINAVTGLLQGVVDQDIFLISALAGVLEVAVQFTGDLLVGVTQVVARVVARLTGAGVIPPSDDPLPPPPAQSLMGISALPTAVLV